MKTSQQIIKELIDKGYSRTHLSEISGVSVSTICRVLTGQYKDMDWTPGRQLEKLLAQPIYNRRRTDRKRE